MEKPETCWANTLGGVCDSLEAVPRVNVTKATVIDHRVVRSSSLHSDKERGLRTATVLYWRSICGKCPVFS